MKNCYKENDHSVKFKSKSKRMLGVVLPHPFLESILQLLLLRKRINSQKKAPSIV